jgi:hypothetical protein
MKGTPIFKEIWRLTVVVCLLIIMFFTASSSWAQPAGQISPDMLAIQGLWMRTDAPYVIELRHAEGGALRAAYYNPRPIHVARTEFAEQEGLLKVMIELQDVNYPGSTYVLVYDRGQDHLRGIYFHPESQQTFEVEFVRQPGQ